MIAAALLLRTAALIAAALLLRIFFILKLNIFPACTLKNLQNFFMKSLPLHTSCLYFMLLNEDILDTEKPDGICSLTYRLSIILHLLFLHPKIFSDQYSISA